MDDRLEPGTRRQKPIGGVVNSTSPHAGRKGRTARQLNRVLGRFERLERRDLLSINIRFDYSMDDHGFFNDPLRRDILELAAETFEDRLGGFLSEIKPSGDNTWKIAIEHPATGEDTSRANLHIRENEVLVFAGGRDLEGNTLGRGGSGAYSSRGSGLWNSTVADRGKLFDSEVAMWGGAITFDTRASWHFGFTESGLAGSNDFYSVAVHELGHLLGFNSIGLGWYLNGSSFTGPEARSVNGGPVPMAPGNGHFRDGTTSDGREAAMDPTVLQGTRKPLTSLDWAVFEDIGWDLSGMNLDRTHGLPGTLVVRVEDAAGRGKPGVFFAP